MQIDIDILLAWGASIKNFKKGELIFEEGTEARRYYQIISGEVKMYNINNDGKEFTQGVFYDGSSFGEPPIFIKEPYPSSTVAVKYSVIIRIAADDFMKILDEYPSLQKQFLVEFARRIFSKSTTLRDITNNPPESRILSFLNVTKKKNGSPKERILIPFTRQEIANLTGLRVETVIRTLIKMQEQDKVEIINHKLYF